MKIFFFFFFLNIFEEEEEEVKKEEEEEEEEENFYNISLNNIPPQNEVNIRNTLLLVWFFIYTTFILIVAH